MGKCGDAPPPPPPSPRQPGTSSSAACGPTRSRRQQQCRGGSGRRCGGAKSARGRTPRRQSAAGVRQCCRVVTRWRPAAGLTEQETPAQATNPATHDDRCGGAGSRPDMLLSDEALKKRPYEANGGVADDRPARSPPPEEEMEAFFAAAELAKRRRFAETYNYDVVLDRPLEGRFEWAPMST